MCPHKLANYIALFIFCLNVALIYAIISVYRSDYLEFEKFLIDHAIDFEDIYQSMINYEEFKAIGHFYSEYDFFQDLITNLRSK